MKRENVQFAVTFFIIVMSIGGLFTYLICRASVVQRNEGRIDIASGRVVGERVTGADGTIEWRWKEGKR